jgi:hypothetical protein
VKKTEINVFFTWIFLLVVFSLWLIKSGTMSMASNAKLFNQLTSKMGNETAENLTTFIENKIVQVVESKIQLVESRINVIETKLNALVEKIDNLASNMATKADLANTKSELIKWSFLFWVGQAAFTLGVIMLFIKK